MQLFISVTPNSTIGFLSKANPGSISDKRLTAESEFLDQVLSYSYKMAGTRFKKEYTVLNITLYVPPRKRESNQMLRHELTKKQKQKQKKQKNKTNFKSS